MTGAERHRELWIGLAEVRHRPGSGMLLDSNAAFANALAYASSEAEYREAIAESLAAVGFDLVSVEDAEPLSTRKTEHAVDAELLEDAAEVEKTGKPRLGTCHTWHSEVRGRTVGRETAIRS